MPHDAHAEEALKDLTTMGPVMRVVSLERFSMIMLVIVFVRFWGSSVLLTDLQYPSLKAA